MDYQFELSAQAHEYIENNSDYTVYSQSPSVSICFNYKNIDPKSLCTALYEEQEVVVGYGSYGETTFVRMVAVNTNNEVTDMMDFFRIVEDFVQRKGDTLEKLE